MLERTAIQRGGWRSREARESRETTARAVPSTSQPVPTIVEVAEPREPSVIPVAYEPPAECTCVDGWCDLDHANA
jgi:hypothetical protein